MSDRKWAQFHANRVRELERERDSLEVRLEKLLDEDSVYRIYDEQVDRAERAEAEVTRFAVALVQATEFVRDYPLGVVDRHYEERRNDVLSMDEEQEAAGLIRRALADDTEEEK